MIPTTLDGYIIHQRHYTDTRKLVDVFTRENGRGTVLYRVSKRASALTLFTRFQFACTGRTVLKTLISAEKLSPTPSLHARSLYCGLYLNELVSRILPEQESFTQVFDCYHETLSKLSASTEDSALQEVLLRRFEFRLLAELGLGLDFQTDACGRRIEADSPSSYYFEPEHGFVELSEPLANRPVFCAADLSQLHRERWTESSLRAAKYISRLALAPLLGSRPLKARELFS